MNRRLFAMALLLAASLAMSGCLSLCSTNEVVRSDEARRPVSFELPAVAEKFSKVAKLDKAKQVGGVYTGVLFITLYSREQWLGENAKFNDAVVKCDTDQNGVITDQEVESFGKIELTPLEPLKWTRKSIDSPASQKMPH